MPEAAFQSLADEPAAAPLWPLWRRILFRFVCCYWVLYALPEPGRASILDSIPGGRWVARPYIAMWHAIVPWVATHAFHVTGRAATYFRTGSGDTTLDYIQNLLFLVISLVAALFWSMLDRRRTNYRALDGWLRLLVRYTLAFTLFEYGFVKIFPLQFRPPNFYRLTEPFGEFSPMGVLWEFMAASKPYIIFSGAAEALGGFLLLFRRTTTLGAMVACAVMANVVALNFCYDVPVKLYSVNLLLMALFLLVPELGRLANVLVLNRAAAPADLAAPRFARRSMRMAACLFWGLFVSYNLAGHVIGGWKAYQSAYVHPKRPPLFGLYDVEGGYANWRKLAIEFPHNWTIRTNDDRVFYYPADYAPQTVVLNHKQTLHWSTPDADHVVLEGGDETIRLRRIDPEKFLLLSRGFHWINEFPFNR